MFGRAYFWVALLILGNVHVQGLDVDDDELPLGLLPLVPAPADTLAQPGRLASFGGPGGNLGDIYCAWCMRMGWMACVQRWCFQGRAGAGGGGRGFIFPPVDGQGGSGMSQGGSLIPQNEAPIYQGGRFPGRFPGWARGERRFSPPFNMRGPRQRFPSRGAFNNNGRRFGRRRGIFSRRGNRRGRMGSYYSRQANPYGMDYGLGW